MNSEVRPYSRGERLADYSVHIVGVSGGIVASIFLLASAAGHANGAAMASLAVYCLGLLAMLSCSAWYNFRRNSPRAAFYRRFDHAAIFVMIAGTYTPILVIKIDGLAGNIWLAVVWAIAAFGVVTSLLDGVRREAILLAVYLAMGWNALLWIDLLLGAVPVMFLVLIGAGGLLYTLGVLFHLFHRLPYQNAMWHALVLAAAACHYVAVFGLFAVTEALWN